MSSTSVSQHAQTMHRFFVEDGLVLAVFCRYNLPAEFEGEIRRDEVNNTFENLEGQDVVSSDTASLSAHCQTARQISFFPQHIKK